MYLKFESPLLFSTTLGDSCPSFANYKILGGRVETKTLMIFRNNKTDKAAIKTWFRHFTTETKQQSKHGFITAIKTWVHQKTLDR